MPRAMRRINRQMKVTFDIPATYTNEEDFALDLADKMDADEWFFTMGDTDVDIKVITIGDIEIAKEED